MVVKENKQDFIDRAFNLVHQALSDGVDPFNRGEWFDWIVNESQAEGVADLISSVGSLTGSQWTEFVLTCDLDPLQLLSVAACVEPSVELTTRLLHKELGLITDPRLLAYLGDNYGTPGRLGNSSRL